MGDMDPHIFAVAEEAYKYMARFWHLTFWGFRANGNIHFISVVLVHIWTVFYHFSMQGWKKPVHHSEWWVWGRQNRLCQVRHALLCHSKLLLRWSQCWGASPRLQPHHGGKVCQSREMGENHNLMKSINAYIYFHAGSWKCQDDKEWQQQSLWEIHSDWVWQEAWHNRG